MTHGTTWIQPESLLKLLDRMISEAETDEKAEIIKKFRREIIDELETLPFEWRRS